VRQHIEIEFNCCAPLPEIFNGLRNAQSTHPAPCLPLDASQRFRRPEIGLSATAEIFIGTTRRFSNSRQAPQIVAGRGAAAVAREQMMDARRPRHENEMNRSPLTRTPVMVSGGLSWLRISRSNSRERTRASSGNERLPRFAVLDGDAIHKALPDGLLAYRVLGDHRTASVTRRVNSGSAVSICTEATSRFAAPRFNVSRVSPDFIPFGDGRGLQFHDRRGGASGVDARARE